MTRLTILACTFLVTVCAVWGQMVEIPLTFANTLPTGTSTYGFIAAAHPEATDEVDTILGEQEIPSLPPPAGVFIVYSVPPSKEYLWVSPKDIRQLKSNEKHLVSYELGVTWTGGQLDVTWGTLPRFVDSAYIVDVISDFPNNFIKQKLIPGAKFTTTNAALTKLRLLVWYDGTGVVSVDNETVLNDIQCFPLPTDGTLTMKGAPAGSHVIIRDLTGRIRRDAYAEVDSPMVNVDDLETGAYSVQITTRDGRSTAAMIMRR